MGTDPAQLLEATPSIVLKDSMDVEVQLSAEGLGKGDCLVPHTCKLLSTLHAEVVVHHLDVLVTSIDIQSKEGQHSEVFLQALGCIEECSISSGTVVAKDAVRHIDRGHLAIPSLHDEMPGPIEEVKGICKGMSASLGTFESIFAMTKKLSSSIGDSRNNARLLSPFLIWREKMSLIVPE